MTTIRTFKEIIDSLYRFIDKLSVIQTLLQNLLQQCTISKDLCNRLYSNMNRLEVARIHGLSKVQKVVHFSHHFYSLIYIFYSLIYHYDQLLPVNNSQ